MALICFIMNKEFFLKLLDYYQIDENQYDELIKDVDSSSFALGHNFKHIDEAIKLVEDSMNKKEKIMIYGDYDADGIMGTSILVKMFMYKNYKVDYYIPSRYLDGYGLNLDKSIEAVDNGVKLMICVDNGVAAFEGIKYLKEHGVKVLVLDHHEIQEELPDADVILHPTFDGFGDVASSGAFVAFNFSRFFLNRFDKYLSTLASISLISDMMPLLDYNRDLLRIVFENYHENEFLQLDLLKEDEPFNETTIGMKIAPKINSIGRVLTDHSINNLIKFFTTDIKEEILYYIDWINETNQLRKNLSKELSEDNIEIKENDKAIVYITEAKEGLLGLIANNILNKYHLPVVVLSYDEEKEIYKGSARAPLGFSVVDAFKYSEKHLLKAGGHALAGGCSVDKNEIDNFSNSFKEYANEHPIEKVEKKTIPLLINELTMDNYNLLKTFAPFGENWPNPEFKLDHIATRSLFFSKNKEHIFTQIGQKCRIVGFNFSYDYVRQFQFVDMIGNIRLNIFNNFTNVEYFVKEINQSK